tara:strand:+ start:2504 stop:4120 length:1617 start_codon:yes stop_codon:yes gene_type:complete
MPRSAANGTGLILLLLVGMFLALLVRTAWQADDAYTAWRLVDNFVHGHGLRNNVAERVQTFTATAWTMLNAFVYYFTNNIYYTSTVLSLVTSAAAVLVVARRYSHSTLQLVFLFGAVMLSLAFMDFSVGGFENPLSHLILAVFASLFFFGDANKRRTFRLLFLVAALGGLNRLDTLALYAPPLLVVLVQAKFSRGDKLRMVALSISPLFAWHLFATIYFGFPLQNAAYAKRFNGIPTSEFVRAGVDYYMNSIYRDPITLTVIVAALYVSWRSGAAKLRAFTVSIAIYLVYILYVGGGYMSGRWFTVPYFAAILAILHSRVLENVAVGRVALPAVLVLGCLGINPTFTTDKFYGVDRERSRTSEWLDKGIADERASWYQHSGLLLASRNTSLPRSLPEWDFHKALTDWKAGMGDGPCIGTMAPAGYFSYLAGPECHVYDLNGQVDPFMARLPIQLNEGWKQAHHFRQAVPGYHETLVTGVNQIQDPDLRVYYDKIRLITRGPIWSWPRLKTIVAMNLGQYDYLLERFAARNAAPAVKPR